MLLAQPFDPNKERQLHLRQQKTSSLLNKFRIISKTKRALCNMRNRAAVCQQQVANVPTRMMPPPPPLPDYSYILSQPWHNKYENGLYDPYVPPMMMGCPPPPLLPLHFALPYSICIHVTPSCQHPSHIHEHRQQEQQHQRHQHHQQHQQHQHPCQHQQKYHDESETDIVTLYSPSNSIYNNDEKYIEELEETQSQEDEENHILELQRLRNRRPTATLNRSFSDSNILPNSQENRDLETRSVSRRPSFQYRLNDSNHRSSYYD